MECIRNKIKNLNFCLDHFDTELIDQGLKKMTLSMCKNLIFFAFLIQLMIICKLTNADEHEHKV